MALRPRLDLRPTQRLGQRLGLSAGVLGALAILRMPAAELAEALAREAETNPFLRPGLPPTLPAASVGGDGTAALVAAAPDWQQDLLHQLAQHPLPPPVARLAAWLVGELDERGWLDTPLPELAAREGLDEGELAAALAAVQGCEPAGVGARDLTECLTLQLLDRGLSADQARATLAELPRFARRDWDGIARCLGLSPAQARDRAALLRGLSPTPVAGRGGAAVPLLRPDLVLSRSPTGEIAVVPARDHLPQPGLDAALTRRALAEGFGTELLARAQALLRAVENRGATLLRIGNWLVRRQEPALTPGPGSGPGALRPALRTDCAADLGLHPSTVGRAVAGKALLADGRLWPLERLFTPPAPGVSRAGDGAPGAAAVAHRIAALIASEPSGHPLSDARIATILSAGGVDMARRTVAKYRHGLRIPPAHRRRDRG